MAKEPDTSNSAQQNSDKVTPKPVPLDPLGNRTTDIPDGAVHGGEETKPGQMEGDEDISPGDPGISRPHPTNHGSLRSSLARNASNSRASQKFSVFPEPRPPYAPLYCASLLRRKSKALGV